MKRISALFALALAGAQVYAAPKVAICSVSEILASGKSTTTELHFDGTQQENNLSSTLIAGMKITVRGAPGAVGNLQSFVLMSIIEDSENGVANDAVAYFVNKNQYSPHFEKVIPGSLIVHLVRANKDKIEVSCFNPQK
jgi:hypothetical protein